MIRLRPASSLLGTFQHIYSRDPALYGESLVEREPAESDEDYKARVSDALAERLRLWREQDQPLPLREGEQPTVFELKYVRGETYDAFRRAQVELGIGARDLVAGDAAAREVVALSLHSVANAGEFALEHKGGRVTEQCIAVLAAIDGGALLYELAARAAGAYNSKN